MAALTPITVTRAGVEMVMQAGNAGGHTFPNADDRTIFIADNASASPVVYTISWGPNSSIDGATPAAKTVSVPAGKRYVFGPYPTQYYNDSNGAVTITPATATSQTVCALKI